MYSLLYRIFLLPSSDKTDLIFFIQYKCRWKRPDIDPNPNNPCFTSAVELVLDSDSKVAKKYDM